MYRRMLDLPSAGSVTFFLWGPRQVGKSTLLRRRYPEARLVDLRRADEFRRYTRRPEALRHELQALGADRPDFVVVDEVLRVPELLHDVHSIIERLGVRFALCASSARKVRRGAATLLGGRAIRYQLHGLVSAEFGEEFDLRRVLDLGYLPGVHRHPTPERLLDAYVGDYLREEIAAEGAVRNLAVFSDFLEAAAICDTEMVRFQGVASDCGVSRQTARAWYAVLVDTLLGRWLPAWRKRPKRRTVRTPKFYFSDVGVVNRLAARNPLRPGSDLFGKAFENWAHHELAAWLDYGDSAERLAYWKLAGGTEVDFIVGDMRVAIEAKAARTIRPRHLKGLRSLVRDHPEVERRLIVCLEERPLRTDDGIEILPAAEFARRLWAGDYEPTSSTLSRDRPL